MTTVDSLIAKYAEPIADSVNLDASEYDKDAEGLASLLRATAGRLGPIDQTGGWLKDAASDLDAVARLGDDGPKTHEVLDRIDSTLYEVRHELELC